MKIKFANTTMQRIESLNYPPTYFSSEIQKRGWSPTESATTETICFRPFQNASFTREIAEM